VIQFPRYKLTASQTDNKEKQMAQTMTWTELMQYEGRDMQISTPDGTKSGWDTLIVTDEQANGWVSFQHCGLPDGGVSVARENLDEEVPYTIDF